MPSVIALLVSDPAYGSAFAAAYPDQPVSPEVLAKAIAAFERTLIVNDTPFDRWLGGDHQAMTAARLRGLAIFTDPERGNCEVCHSAPNFTDNGFHNIGLASFGKPDADLGRYRQKPVAVLKGAFKTPSLRKEDLLAFLDALSGTGPTSQGLMPAQAHADSGASRQ